MSKIASMGERGLGEGARRGGICRQKRMERGGEVERVLADGASSRTRRMIVRESWA